jgi:hypothetical protein
MQKKQIEIDPEKCDRKKVIVDRKNKRLAYYKQYYAEKVLKELKSK